MDPTAEIRHYLIEGHVQGVGFRRFVQRTGEALALSGVVRNLKDGRVEVVAKGDSDVLSKFENEISRGPLHSKVDDCKTKNLRSELLPVETAAPLAKGDFAVLTDGEKSWF